MSAGVQKDRFFRQNVIGISSVEFLWGLGLPVVVESTFLQIFLKKLGASSFVIGLIPFFFYANYATSHCGIEPAIAAGFFVAFIYTGAIAANIFLGTLDLLALKQKYIVSKISSVTALALLTVICTMWGFFLVSFLIGLSRGTRMLAYAPSVKKLSGLQDSTSYFAIGPILTLPLATLLPLATGRFLDHFSFLQADAYRIVFMVGIFLILVALLFIVKTDFEVEKMNVEHRTSNVQHRMK